MSQVKIKNPLRNKSRSNQTDKRNMVEVSIIRITATMAVSRASPGRVGHPAVPGVGGEVQGKQKRRKNVARF